MKAKLQQKIIEKYPKFFEHLKDYEGPVIPIQFGFECGDGWYVLIDSLMDCINSYVKSKEEYPDTQIKSKFWRIAMPKLERRFRYRRKISKKLFEFKKGLELEKLPVPYVQLNQVKEKFGGLRFYISGGNDFIDGMISVVEDLSYRTCELCGSTENVGQTEGWIVTVCKSCFDKGLTNLKNWSSTEE